MVILPVALNSSWTMKTAEPGEANYVSEQRWENIGLLHPVPLIVNVEKCDFVSLISGFTRFTE